MKEVISFMATLCTILAFGVSIIDQLGPDDPPLPPPRAEHKIIILARTAFNDSGQMYVQEFNGSVLPLNDSIVIQYIL